MHDALEQLAKIFADNARDADARNLTWLAMGYRDAERETRETLKRLMPRPSYEYEVHQFEPHETFDHCVNFLNEWGKKGWQLVAWNPMLQGVVIMLMRQVQS